MPNHIKNKIELIGSDEDVKSFIEKFSTVFPEEEFKTYDGRLICKTKDGKVGWLNKESSVFERRDQASVLGMPDEYEIEMAKSWVRMPDFEKIYPTPEVIELVGSSVSSNIVDAVHKKFNAKFSDNPLLASLQQMNRNNNVNEIKPEDQMQFERACKAYQETGFAYWYDYQNAKWGTKWNAYDCEKINETTFTFDTAWSGVPDLILEMSKSFNGNIIYAYSDEDTGYNVGSYLFSSGITISDYNPTGGSIGAYDIAFELRPDSKQYYILEDGEYKYKEEED